MADTAREPSDRSRDEAPGPKLLVASPRLVDPNFERSVVLLLEDGSDGAVGLVLNRPLPAEVAEILEPWGEQAELAPPARVFRGGPVAPDTVIALGRCRDGLPAGSAPAALGRQVVGPVALVDLTVGPDPTVLGGVRIFAGYAGWSSGQLRQELEEGAWFPVAAEPDDVLGSDPERLWHDVLRRQRGPLALLAAYPLDPSHN
jgi:putative transcriptional regulator